MGEKGNCFGHLRIVRSGRERLPPSARVQVASG